jgi:predicted nucleic acid-binding Zn ribbon protein
VNMETLGAILQRALRDLGIDRPIRRADAIRLWPKAVGEKISQMTEPQFFSNGKMFVKVKSDVWRNELFFHKKELIRRLNDEIGEWIVEDIVLK